MARLTRRAFFASAAAALPAVAAEGAPRTLPLGFSLYGMRSLQTADALRACAAIGYEAVELALLPGWPADPTRLSADDRRALRRQLADTGLSLAGLMENLAE